MGRGGTLAEETGHIPDTAPFSRAGYARLGWKCSAAMDDLRHRCDQALTNFLIESANGASAHTATADSPPNMLRYNNTRTSMRSPHGS